VQFYFKKFRVDYLERWKKFIAERVKAYREDE
jgi:hypothetical protein